MYTGRGKPARAPRPQVKLDARRSNASEFRMNTQSAYQQKDILSPGILSQKNSTTDSPNATSIAASPVA